jgi:hypothetical protein
MVHCSVDLTEEDRSALVAPAFECHQRAGHCGVRFLRIGNPNVEARSDYFEFCVQIMCQILRILGF